MRLELIGPRRRGLALPPILAVTIVAVPILAVSASVAVARPLKAAVFDFELIDTSLEGERGERADQSRRIALASAELRRLLAAEADQVALVDLAPQAAEIERQSPLFKCNGCDEDIARAAGAEVEVLPVVQKTSNLILSFTVLIKRVGDGATIRAGSVDIRGNNDEMWLRGVRWVVKNRLLATALPDVP